MSKFVGIRHNTAFMQAVAAQFQARAMGRCVQPTLLTRTDVQRGLCGLGSE